MRLLPKNKMCNLSKRDAEGLLGGINFSIVANAIMLIKSEQWDKKIIK